MRLRRLELQNFRRHTATTIEIPDGVTALVGANGAGKSSLLEALGFALFGTDGLRTSKTLLRTETAAPGDPVSVLAELELAGQALTIHRELRGKSLTPSASLTVDGVVLVPAGAGSSEATTQEVRRRLGMEPDAFFTTIVARQGELASLSSQAPAERKRLILRMLGVDKLDAAIVKARETRRDADAAVTALRAVMPDSGIIEAELVQVRDEVAQLEAQLATAGKRRIEVGLALAQAQLKVEALQKRVDERRTQAASLEALRREGALIQRAVAAAAAALKAAQEATARAAQLETLASQLPVRQARWLDAQQGQQAAKHRASLVATANKIEAELQAITASLPAGPTAQAIPLKSFEDTIEASEKKAELLAGQLEVVRAEAAAGEARLEHLAHLGSGAPCPTCERPLEGLASTLRQRTQDTAANARTQSETLARDVALARRELTAARAAFADAQATNQRLQLQAVEQAAKERQRRDLEARLTEVRTALPPEVPAVNLVLATQELEAARTAHDSRTKLLAHAEKLPALQVEADQSTQEQAVLAQRLTEHEQLLAKDPDPALELQQSRADWTAVQRADRQAELDEQTVRAKLDASRARVSDLVKRQADASTLAKRLEDAELESREWTALTDGRNGLLERFRDNVVDRIGPAIQAEASRLLASFTGGRYSELLLDADYGIYLGDGGVRYSLERFSGGEQDVAHLALRLAVSRMLAERAGGVELRFLALDEVFGHLDEDRRNQVVAALHSLSGLYAQVLVVSHLATLNEALDQAISVELVDGESRVSLRND